MRMTRALRTELINALQAEAELDDHWVTVERWINDRVRFPDGYVFNPTTNMVDVDGDIEFTDDADGAAVQVIEFFQLERLA